jgi:transposase
MKKLSKPTRKRLSFTPAFKAERSASRGSRERRLHCELSSARELDLTETSLRAWVQQAEVDEHPDPQGPLTTEDGTELTRLRRELRTLEPERDFLKKPGGVVREQPVVKSAAIAAHVGAHTAAFMCRVVGVARREAMSPGAERRSSRRRRTASSLVGARIGQGGQLKRSVCATGGRTSPMRSAT